MADLIERQIAIDAIKTWGLIDGLSEGQAIEILSDENKVPSAEPEAISKWKKEFREYVDSLDIARDDWKGIIEYIDELPSAQPDTTTHDSIPAETGKNDGDGTSGDCISRQQAIYAVEKSMYENPHENSIIRGMHDHEHRHFLTILMGLPSIQPERKRGKWIERESDTEDKENGFKTVIVCTCCDFPATTFYSEDCESRTQIRTDFCPNCGAKMEKR